MNKPKLIPPDKKQCQAEKPNGNNFMTFGGVVGLVRCENKPIWIAKEIIPNPLDGLRGSMSLCDDCRKVFEAQMPNRATFKKIG